MNTTQIHKDPKETPHIQKIRQSDRQTHTEQRIRDQKFETRKLTLLSKAEPLTVTQG